MNIRDYFLFGNPNTNITTDSNLTPDMKEYYDKNLIRLTGPQLIHDQFAQKRPIPKNGGKVIKFRQYKPFPKALTPLTEGVTPDGRKLQMTEVSATIKQYGDYVTLSDMLLLTALDNNLLESQQLLSDQAGRTLDTVTREVMHSGTNVLYAGGKSARAALTKDDKLTVDTVKRAARILKNANAPKIDKYYVAIINPDTSYDLQSDEAWIDASKYAGSTQIFEGEVGKIAGVRFIESTEAKIFNEKSTSGARIYGTLFLGANAYGTTEIEGGGLEMIVKQKGSAGTADPLNQRATAGWKAAKTAELLVSPYIVRCEHCVTLESDPN
ncbi:N4-gp56 family major capsid protein [Mogibacterium diversum]|uniref:N4-gp56 family major capsid protein n=1 Tax=Mogibacterium diversum TaxID=114527 RepID=A0A2S0L5P8_9FIRM|nr:N4-gp56 family major capsid protein [Mogibacterium diversum]AVM48602.1 N4-gp56 family major capsid protein [Mogibacterium diversum]